MRLWSELRIVMYHPVLVLASINRRIPSPTDFHRRAKPRSATRCEAVAISATATIHG